MSFISKWSIRGWLVLLFAAAGCSPAVVSRIGPGLDPRPDDCDVEVLNPEEKPSRPYRDVGVVALEQCPDYRQPPCRKWLTRSACQLGGQVAYLLGEGREEPAGSPTTFRVMVATYVANLPRPSKNCDPECAAGETCVEGRCRQRDAECNKPVAQQDPAVERCLD